jgi:UDP-N-acetylglucosamine 2-epimerase (non-hydrolysing)
MVGSLGEDFCRLGEFRLMSNAALVLTDSGGIQEETTVLGVPCVTLRNNTERPITVTDGTNVLAGTNKKEIVPLVLESIERRKQAKIPRYWDGKAGTRIVEILARELESDACLA